MEKINIVKVGGHVIDNEIQLHDFLSEFAGFPGKKILVHGGGKIASDISRKLGINPRMADGRRITDAETLDVAVMVYGGLINKKIVAALQSMQCNAIGLCGADANIIQSVKRPVAEIDYGFVGDIRKINSSMLLQLLSAGLIPVISSLTHDGRGQLLNTNADTIAAQLAIALSADYEVQLSYCFEKNGVLMDINEGTEIYSHITAAIYAQLKREQVISSGMIPKLDNAFNALQNGVAAVIIGNTSNLKAIINQEQHAGTRLTA